MAVLNTSSAENEFSSDKSFVGELVAGLATVRAKYYYLDDNSFAYQAFASSKEFDLFTTLSYALSQFKPEQLASREEKLAFWLNVYNMLMIHGVIAHNITTSVHDERKFFTDSQYKIGEHTLSLDEIEHGILRGNAKKYLAFSHTFARADARNRLIINIPDPRVHFAFYSACRSSPPWHIYKPEAIDEQLGQAVSALLQRDLNLGAGGASMQIPKFFQWYEDDFGDRARVITLIADYFPDDPQMAIARDNPGRVEFSYLDFDWTLNSHH